jgi:hypothetical protein
MVAMPDRKMLRPDGHGGEEDSATVEADHIAIPLQQCGPGV